MHERNACTDTDGNRRGSVTPQSPTSAATQLLQNSHTEKVDSVKHGHDAVRRRGSDPRSNLAADAAVQAGLQVGGETAGELVLWCLSLRREHNEVGHHRLQVGGEAAGELTQRCLPLRLGHRGWAS